jgi:hypothetical protein
MRQAVITYRRGTSVARSLRLLALPYFKENINKTIIILSITRRYVILPYKTNKKNHKKHLENPPKMHASQRRHTSHDGGLHSRATARTTPSNSPL